MVQNYLIFLTLGSGAPPHVPRRRKPKFSPEQPRRAREGRSPLEFQSKGFPAGKSLTAAIQNIKRMVSSFFLALFCLSLQQNPAFADWRGLSMVWDFPQGNRIRFLQGVAVTGKLAPPSTSLYAHHISPLLSKIITSFSMAIAFSSPSVGVIRLSSCSMEIIPS